MLSRHKFTKPPLVEVVCDVDCDLSPNFDLAAKQDKIKGAFAEDYPKVRRQFLREHTFSSKAPNQPPEISFNEALQAVQLYSADDRQLVQVRRGGFSFNRLAPYSTFDEYAPVICKAWDAFTDLVKPVQVRRIALRYINRISLPAPQGRVNLGEYLVHPPSLPMVNLEFSGFLHQHSGSDPVTKNRVNIVLTLEAPMPDSFPLLFDIEAFSLCACPPPEWDSLLQKLTELRSLNNAIFLNTLTDQCKALF